MEKLGKVRSFARAPRGVVWVLAYGLLLGVKPWMLNQVQALAGLVPMPVLVTAVVLALIYFLILPARLRAHFKDLWDGGDPRVQSRKALTELKEAIQKESDTASAEKLLAARMALCMAMVLFQNSEYDEASRTAATAQQALTPVAGSAP